MHSAVPYSFPVSMTNEEVARRDMNLVTAARAGSSTAFEELQNLYSRRLYKRIFSMTKNREDAEDALQDTFLRAYVALDSFEGRSNFSSWLTRIAINSALMTLRKRRSRAEVCFDLPAEAEEQPASFDVPDIGLNPEQMCDQSQRCHRLLRRVNKLHPKLSSALAIWIKQECSMKELASTLDVSLASVKARLHRARMRLITTGVLAGTQRYSNPLPGGKHRHPVR
jgi:RNA polymerase sigma-70 factor, ECF subfamily